MVVSLLALRRLSSKLSICRLEFPLLASSLAWQGVIWTVQLDVVCAGVTAEGDRQAGCPEDWEPCANRNRLGALRCLSENCFWVICSSYTFSL